MLGSLAGLLGSWLGLGVGTQEKCQACWRRRGGGGGVVGRLSCTHSHVFSVSTAMPCSSMGLVMIQPAADSC